MLVRDYSFDSWHESMLIWHESMGIPSSIFFNMPGELTDPKKVFESTLWFEASEKKHLTLRLPA